jgi:bifunctional DNA-binding transcriptional regulator/antitoxin component of YhaV-PrlF toxin-antitoxin module
MENGRELSLKDKTYTADVAEILEDGSAVLTLPDEMMEELGWSNGTRLDITEEDGVIVMKKIETDMNRDVIVFIDACDQLPSVENISLYRNLINEEFWEFQDALKANDDVEQLDACMDMIWVILGYCKMKGFNVDGAWAEVARSNLAKIDKDTGKVIKNEAGKVMKPANWFPPALAPFVTK